MDLIENETGKQCTYIRHEGVKFKIFDNTAPSTENADKAIKAYIKEFGTPDSTKYPSVSIDLQYIKNEYPQHFE